MKERGEKPKNVTVDLITGLPVPESDTLKIYSENLTNLLREKPTGWQKVLESHCSRDRVIPDDMEEMMKQKVPTAQQPTNYISVKLMSWGPGENYQIRPGQTIKVQQFDDPKLREAYLALKWLIKTFKLNVSSYMLKKALLGSSAYRVEGLLRNSLIKNTMLTPELVAAFRTKVNIDAVPFEGDIPLR